MGHRRLRIFGKGGEVTRYLDKWTLGGKGRLCGHGVTSSDYTIASVGFCAWLGRSDHDKGKKEKEKEKRLRWDEDAIPLRDTVYKLYLQQRSSIKKTCYCTMIDYPYVRCLRTPTRLLFFTVLPLLVDGS